MGIQKVAFNFIVKNAKGELVKSVLCSKRQAVCCFEGLRYVPAAECSAGVVPKALPKKVIADIFADEQKITQSAQSIIKNRLLSEGETIHNVRFYSKDKLIRMRAGKEYEGFKGLYRDDKNFCCYLNDRGEITHTLMLDKKSGEVYLLDLVNKTEQHYTKADVEALHYYKYHPDAIHRKLRHNKNLYSGSFQQEAEKVIETLKNIFADRSKTSVNRERRTIYRALQDGLSADEKTVLQKAGAIFEDKSFCSATSDLNVAKRFAHGKPIIEIDLLEGANYIDMDKIFNIDREHWLEKEILLGSGSKFQITGFDKENNIIKVKYLL